jgi:hypothetical protein
MRAPLRSVSDCRRPCYPHRKWVCTSPCPSVGWACETGTGRTPETRYLDRRRADTCSGSGSTSCTERREVAPRANVALGGSRRRRWDELARAPRIVRRSNGLATDVTWRRDELQGKRRLAPAVRASEERERLGVAIVQFEGGEGRTVGSHAIRIGRRDPTVATFRSTIGSPADSSPQMARPHERSVVPSSPAAQPPHRKSPATILELAIAFGRNSAPTASVVSPPSSTAAGPIGAEASNSLSFPSIPNRFLKSTGAFRFGRNIGRARSDEIRMHLDLSPHPWLLGRPASTPRSHCTPCLSRSETADRGVRCFRHGLCAPPRHPWARRDHDRFASRWHATGRSPGGRASRGLAVSPEKALARHNGSAKRSAKRAESSTARAACRFRETPECLRPMGSL